MSWPAFGGAPIDDIDVAFERGIWGKMHAAPTDYRWIARSQGLPQAGAALELLLLVGPESAPAVASLWRSHEAQYLAAATYPSPSRDAAGRTGFLEKQVFVARRIHGVPAVSLAFALLPLVRRQGFADWWDRRQDPRWQERDFFVPLKVEPQTIKGDDIHAAIEAGLKQLREIPGERLQRAYAAVLSTPHKPAILESNWGPLSAEATAALLLPLPPARADYLSIAGWSLSTQYRQQRRETPWDIIVQGRPPRDERDAVPASVPFASDVQRRAEDMVRAIHDADPQRLWSDHAPVLVPVPLTRRVGEAASTPILESREKSARAEELSLSVPSRLPNEPATVEASIGSSTEVSSAPVPSSAIVEEATSTPAESLGHSSDSAELEFDDGGRGILQTSSEPSDLEITKAWKELCDDIETGEKYENLKQHEKLLRELPTVVREWLKYACSKNGFIDPRALALPERWTMLESGDPALLVLRSALRALETSTRPNRDKTDLVRAALLVLDRSLSPTELRQQRDAFSSASVDALEFLGRLNRTESADFKRRWHKSL